MGAWGVGPFENDGALDALCGLDDRDAGSMMRPLAAAHNEEIYLEVDHGQAAIVAAELVAAASGRPSKGLPRRLTDVLATHGDGVCGLGAVRQARAAVARVVAKNSERADRPPNGALRPPVASLSARIAPAA